MTYNSMKDLKKKTKTVLTKKKTKLFALMTRVDEPTATKMLKLAMDQNESVSEITRKAITEGIKHL